MTYLVPQLNQGTPLDNSNCGPASVAEGLRWATGHAVAPTPPQVRKAMHDNIGGTGLADHVTAWASFKP